MKKMRQITKRIGFILMQFLIDFSFYLFLFCFPFVIILKFQSVDLIASALIFFGFSRLTTPFIIKNIIKKDNPRTYYILGFSLLFFSIILLNKTLTYTSVLLIAFLWAFAHSFIKYASRLLINIQGKELIGGWEYLHRPVIAAALILTPIFGNFLVFQANLNSVISYLGIIVSITALIYLSLFNKLAYVEGQLFKINLAINKTTVVAGFLTGYFWIYSPLVMYLERGKFNEIPWVLLWFNLPYLLLLILKNIFKIKIWQLRSEVKAVLLIMSLLPFAFALSSELFTLAVIFLGFVLALVQSSNAAERNYAKNYSMQQMNFGAGFLMAVIIGFISISASSFGNGLVALAFIITIWLIANRLKISKFSSIFKK